MTVPTTRTGAMSAGSRVNADARLVAAHEFFRKGEASAEGWSMLIARGRGWESAYRDRWRHDKVVRSTHGVNCTGSCSWNVYVKDGLITWESQAVDYPRTDPDRPEPRAARLPARRVVLVVHVLAGPPEVPVRPREPARAAGAPRANRRRTRSRRSREVAADGRYRGERGRGGFVRCDWEEASELIAAATVHAIREHGPGPGRRLHADPGDVAGLVRGRHALPVADRRAHDDVL